MASTIYWIDHFGGSRLAIMARPRAGDWLSDEIEHWRRSGICEVVSLLETEEVRDLDLSDEARLCTVMGIRFRSFPIPDRGVPASASALRELAMSILEAVSQDRPVAIHCRAGIGRSSLVAAAVLALAGVPMSEAFAMLAHARGLKVPDTDEQSNWLIENWG